MGGGGLSGHLLLLPFFKNADFLYLIQRKTHFHKKEMESESSTCQ